MGKGRRIVWGEIGVDNEFSFGFDEFEVFLGRLGGDVW